MYYRFNENEAFQEAIMLDDGNSFDEKANDDIYGVQIIPKYGESSIEYYIVAENAKTVNFDPPNYMYQRHKVSLAELNK